MFLPCLGAALLPLAAAQAAHAAEGARLSGTRVDAMALLFLFVVVLVLCVVSSCLDDATEEGRAYRLAEESPAASPRQPSRARERSPIWRKLEQAQ